jgi:hypothetical protein
MAMVMAAAITMATARRRGPSPSQQARGRLDNFVVGATAWLFLAQSVVDNPNGDYGHLSSTALRPRQDAPAQGITNALTSAGVALFHRRGFHQPVPDVPPAHRRLPPSLPQLDVLLLDDVHASSKRATQDEFPHLQHHP